MKEQQLVCVAASQKGPSSVRVLAKSKALVSIRTHSIKQCFVFDVEGEFSKLRKVCNS